VMADAPLAPSAIELVWPRAAESISVSVLLEGDESSVDGRADRMMSLLTRGTVRPVPRGTDGLPSGHTKRPDGSSAHPTLEADGRDQRPPDQRDSDRPGDTAHADVEPAVGPVRVGRVSVDDQGRPHGTTIKVAFWAGQLAHVLRLIRESGAQHGVDPAISGSAGAGVLDVVADQDVEPEAVAGFLNELRARLDALAAGGVVPSVASAVVVWAPPEVRDSVDLWGPVPSLRLMRAVKDQFDPEHRLAPGRFAGGI
jgi:FAD/FMN-containing dehydrogenase